MLYNVHMYICVIVYIYVSLCMYVYVCVSIYVYICMYAYSYSALMGKSSYDNSLGPLSLKCKMGASAAEKLVQLKMSSLICWKECIPNNKMIEKC